MRCMRSSASLCTSRNRSPSSRSCTPHSDSYRRPSPRPHCRSPAVSCSSGESTPSCRIHATRGVSSSPHWSVTRAQRAYCSLAGFSRQLPHLRLLYRANAVSHGSLVLCLFALAVTVSLLLRDSVWRRASCPPVAALSLLLLLSPFYFCCWCCSPCQSWSLVEVPRYAFYALSLVSTPSYFSKFVRYSLFLILYPSGISGEVLSILSALPFIAHTKIFAYPMPNKINFAFDYTTFCYFILATYIPGSYIMYNYMLVQRKKQLSPPATPATDKKAQ